MGKPKHAAIPLRLKETKKPRASLAKGHFRTNVLAKRRHTYYDTGKGSVGVLIRFPRLVRLVRQIRKDQNARYAELGGISQEDEEHSVIFKAFPQTLIGGIDSYANLVMEFAYDHAKSRQHADKGLKLRISDIDFAVNWIKRLARE